MKVNYLLNRDNPTRRIVERRSGEPYPREPDDETGASNGGLLKTSAGRDMCLQLDGQLPASVCAWPSCCGNERLTTI
jgi:hypothetical protein